MTDETRPGLRIRRKVDTPAATEEAPAEANDGESAGEAEVVTPNAAAPVSESAPALPTRTDTSSAADEGSAQPAVRAPAAGGRKSDRVWRSDRVPPPGAAPEPADEAPVRELSNEPMPTTDDFAAMLGDAPLQIARFSVGDKVTARIVVVGDDTLFASLGGKSEGVISRAEFLDDEGELTVGVGDEVEAYVVSSRGGSIRLSVALGHGSADSAMLEDACQQQIPVEGRVTGTNKGGYDVAVLGSRGFCPFSQIDIESGRDPEAYVGETYRFLITRAEEGGRNVVLSRAALIRAEREAAAADILRDLKIGDELDGLVTRIAEFGAFVDIGGVDGLVHVSQLGWSRVEDPNEVVSVGDRVRVAVLGVSDLDDPARRRISLSMKALAEDPWVATVRTLHPGDAMPGTVVRLERYGAFVEIAPGVDGLVHVSEVSRGRRIHHPKEVLTVGDPVHVQVLRVDPQKRQIALSIQALMDDPWLAAASQYRVGTTIQGHVDSIQSFGVFVELSSGISGLIPMSHLEDDEQRNVHNRFRPGTEVEARVIAVEPERHRLTLSRRKDTDAEARAAYDEYQSQSTASDDGRGFGTFADLLKKKG